MYQLAQRVFRLCRGIVLLWLGLHSSAFAGETARLIAELEPQIRRGMEATVMNDFAGAAELFQDIIRRYPGHPVGYFYAGANLQAQMLDAEDYQHLPEFQQAMQQTVDLSRALHQQHPEPWLLFLEGSAWLYTSFMDSKQGSMWSAYRHARRGVGLLEEVIAQDSTLYDAWLGVGSFKYWKSSKARSLTWLPFVDDERIVGMEMVRTACRSGRFTALVGADQLAWILLDAGRPEEALRLARSNYERFPGSRFFQWTLVNVCYRNGLKDEAYTLYAGLLEQLREQPGNNHYNEITCLWRLAEIAAERREYGLVLDYTGQLLQLPLDESVAGRTAKKREDARKWQQQARERLALQPQNGATPGSSGSR